MAVNDDADAIGELLRRAQAGDAKALQSLLERYREFVRLVVRCRGRKQLQARVDSSDLIQETLLRAAQHIGEFDGKSEQEWRAWLGRIAEREVIRQLRWHLGAEKRALTRERPLASPNPDSSITGSGRFDQWLAKMQSSPSAAVQRQERALILSDSLAKLPADYREVLILRHLEERSFPDIAEQMIRSPGAVRVLWVRALKKLRELCVHAQE